MSRCAVLRRQSGVIDVHGTKCPRYEHKVIALADGQSEEFDEGRATRAWLHPYLIDGFHLMEFTDIVPQHQDKGPCTLGVGCDEAGVCYADAHGAPDRCPRRG